MPTDGGARARGSHQAQPRPLIVASLEVVETVRKFALLTCIDRDRLNARMIAIFTCNRCNRNDVGRGDAHSDAEVDIEVAVLNIQHSR